MQKCHSFFNKITWKIEILKKWKKCLEISSFYSFLPKMTNTWCMVLEIWSVTEKKKIFFILIIFCPFTTLTLKIKIFKKWKKKTPGYIIILYKCTINDNHTIYGSWDTKCDRQNFLSFWAMLCPFTPQQPKTLTFWKNEKTKKKRRKKHLEIFGCPT